MPARLPASFKRAVVIPAGIRREGASCSFGFLLDSQCAPTFDVPAVSSSLEAIHSFLSTQAARVLRPKYKYVEMRNWVNNELATTKLVLHSPLPLTKRQIQRVALTGLKTLKPRHETLRLPCIATQSARQVAKNQSLKPEPSVTLSPTPSPKRAKAQTPSTPKPHYARTVLCCRTW